MKEIWTSQRFVFALNWLEWQSVRQIVALVKKQQLCICCWHMLTWVEISVQCKCCVCVKDYMWVYTLQLSTADWAVICVSWNSGKALCVVPSSITHPPIEALESDPITTPPSKVAARMVVWGGKTRSSGTRRRYTTTWNLGNYTLMPLKKSSNQQQNEVKCQWRCNRTRCSFTSCETFSEHNVTNSTTITK